MQNLIVIIVVFLVIYYASLILFEKHKKNYAATTQSQTNNPVNKKKLIIWVFLGFIIGIPVTFIVFLILAPLFIFLGLGASEASDSERFLINFIISAAVILTPFLGVFIGWKLAKKTTKIS
jgi:ABC-type multidrug transport system permease subunit